MIIGPGTFAGTLSFENAQLVRMKAWVTRVSLLKGTGLGMKAAQMNLVTGGGWGIVWALSLRVFVSQVGL